MVSLGDQTFSNIFSSHHDMDDYGRYPDPPHSTASYETNNTSPIDMSSMYSIPSSVSFEQSLYAEASNYVLNHNRASPGMYADDSELRIPSSSLSTNSATSSVAASPESNPGQQLGAGPEWHPHGVHPSIVGNDYMATPEYAGFPSQGLEEFTYEYAHSKGYVGMLRLYFSIFLFAIHCFFSPLCTGGRFAPARHHLPTTCLALTYHKSNCPPEDSSLCLSRTCTGCLSDLLCGTLAVWLDRLHPRH